MSEGVGRAHHASAMETAGAALAAAAGLGTRTPGIVNMQAASRPAPARRREQEVLPGVSLKVTVHYEGYFVSTILSNKRQSRRRLGIFFFFWRGINNGTTAAPVCKYASEERSLSLRCEGRF